MAARRNQIRFNTEVGLLVATARQFDISAFAAAEALATTGVTVTRKAIEAAHNRLLDAEGLPVR